MGQKHKNAFIWCHFQEIKKKKILCKHFFHCVRKKGADMEI